jgi:beta-glucanase (GH16 family)
MNQLTVLPFVFAVAGIPLPKPAPAAEPVVQTNPAVQVRFIALRDKFYQWETAPSDAGPWKAFDRPVKGDGREVVCVVPVKSPAKPRFRVRELHKQWVLVWNDEFDGRRLDTTKWAKEENGYGGGNQERQFYSTNPKYCFVKNGRLHIAVYRDRHTTTDGKTQPYTSARIRTLHRGDWKYGRFEVRAKVPGGQGIWPAVWMLPTDSKYGGWAASGEIDILESRGSRADEAVGTIHFGGRWPRNKHLGTTHKLPGKNAAAAFHTYAVEWTPDAIRWSVDGVTYQTRRKAEWSSEAAPKSATAPFDRPFHLILNVAVDGNFFRGTGQRADNLPASAFPQVFAVEWVRVYQWAE